VIVTVLYIIGILNFLPNEISVFLTLTGLFIIIKQQILDAKEFSDLKPKTIRNWIKSFPTIKPITISLESAILTSGILKARVATSVSADASIEEKVDFLLRQVEKIQNRIAGFDDRINDVANSITKKSKELQADIDSLSESLKTLVAGHIVGDYDINMFGIIITICGTLIQYFST
jgi:uncharacterized protein YlxW (UPF0749 family)